MVLRRGRAVWALVASLLVAGSMVERAAAQVLCTDVRNARAFHGLNKIKLPPFLEMAHDPNTKVLLDSVFTVWGIQGANWQVLNFNDGKTYSNAWAIYCDNRHYIVTNARYVTDMNTMVSRGAAAYTKDETYWGLVGIIAHEAAHHFRNHAQIRARTTEERHRYELEADHTMGFVLAKLGAPEKDTLQSIRDLPAQGSDTHPPGAARRAAIARGWADGKEASVRAPAPESSAPSSSRSAKPVALPPPPAPPPVSAPRSVLSGFEYRHSRDIEGHDISSTGGKPGIPGTTHEVCAQLCEAEKRCKAYSFDKWHARCFLKDTVAESYLEPNSVLGVKKPGHLPLLKVAATRITENYRNKVFRDVAIGKPAPAANFEACRSSCERDWEQQKQVRCVVFTYEKATNLCSMYAKSDGFFFDQAYDSGAIRHVR